jgi:hypothetical protein
MKKVDCPLEFTCPICAAKPGNPCVTFVDTPRNQSHLRRRDIAKDYESSLRRLQPLASQPGRSIKPDFD